jgi:hypothetical protein
MIGYVTSMSTAKFYQNGVKPKTKNACTAPHTMFAWTWTYRNCACVPDDGYS